MSNDGKTLGDALAADGLCIAEHEMDRENRNDLRRWQRAYELLDRTLIGPTLIAADLEAAARLLYEDAHSGYFWADVAEDARISWRRFAARVLRAALPELVEPDEVVRAGEMSTHVSLCRGEVAYIERVKEVAGE